MLEKTLESPLNCKEIQPVHSKGDQSWVFIGRTDVEAETPILWPPDAKSWLIWKDPDAGKGWRQEEKRTTEDEMDEWHHRLDGHESEWTPGVGDGQGGLACCDSWGRKESNTTERLNWTELSFTNNSIAMLTDQLIMGDLIIISINVSCLHLFRSSFYIKDRYLLLNLFLSINCWIQFVNILLRIFSSIFIRDIGISFFFVVVLGVFVLFCY